MKSRMTASWGEEDGGSDQAKRKKDSWAWPTPW